MSESDALRRYERARDDVVAQLSLLEERLTGERQSAVAAARKRLARGKFVLAIVGEFSSGKSFLINVLLEKFRYEDTGGARRLVGLLTTDINPTTATITELGYGTSDEATAVYEDGRAERIPLASLGRFTAVGSGDAGGLHDATADERDAPTHVTVKTDSPFLQRGFVVADTPGLASVNPAHRRATLQFLPSADAVVYAIDTQQPFTEGDAAFLGIIREHIDSIFIVQTKIDLWQEMQGGRPAWEDAFDRIARLAAIHAPGTYVLPLSARQYAQGVLDGDAAAADASRFPHFLNVLDASLVDRTGRARLRRAGERAADASSDELERLDGDLAMLSLDDAALERRRAAVVPELHELDERCRERREALIAQGTERRLDIDRRGVELSTELERALAQAFDTADVARLRDRQRLHVVADRVVAHVVGDFAQATASAVIDELDAGLAEARALVPLRWSAGEAAAHAFGTQAGTSLWGGDVRAAIASTIVFEAIGGPSIALVSDIAGRFAARRSGDYMKRELIADLRSEIFPRLRAEIASFVADAGVRLQRIYDDLAHALGRAAIAKRDGDLGSIERALEARGLGDAAAAGARLRARRQAVEDAAAHVAKAAAAFVSAASESTPADAGPAIVRSAHAARAFDPVSYDRGLQPQRWRVAVFGALRRGKSSLINAFAGRTAIDDRIAGSVRFPIHVRYGERDTAFALDDRGEWEEIPFASAADAAAERPVLVLVPWNLPRELVLVHVPAFDSGDPHAEDVNIAVATHASEMVCLFSRQLSDRELDLYAQLAELGRPMLFAHTIADNESSNERRHVVELAAGYLKEHNVAAERIFTVSARDYETARAAGRAASPWNETEALRSTLEARAETHMSRLQRRAAAASNLPETGPDVAAPARPKGLFARLLGRQQ
jgi:predicted GTPase